ncbi:MAG: MBOAT family protein [Lachnospiraceae bacterium]|nr:MBOAT family protein [Lachnospiraceae bacterium]
MLFNSYIFIFIFLPVTLLGYYLINHFKKYSIAKLFLAGMSLWFYAYFNLYYLFIIIGSVIFNYSLSYIIDRYYRKNSSSVSESMQKIFLLTGVLANLSLLFYFKYFDFLLDNINYFFNAGLRLHNILLPLGISFFTFQQLSFIIDRAKLKAPHYNFTNYLCFVTFFPQLVAGPIVLYEEMIPQFEDKNKKSFNTDNFSKGLMFFVIGLSKKVLLADVLAMPANHGFSNAGFLDTPSVLVTALCFTFQLYFDFSGYSDMAIGLGRMFNIELPVNFNSPYHATTVKEFWQRWHITLSKFFFRYVYIPAGGSRKGKLRTTFNVFLVFFLSGIWHGANWTFFIWGAAHGLMVAFDNLYLIGSVPANANQNSSDSKKQKVPKIKLPRFVGWLYTFMFWSLSLLFFGSDSISTSITMFKNLFAFKNTGYIYKLASSINTSEFYLVNKAVSMKAPQYSNYVYLFLLCLVLVISALVIKAKNARQIVLERPLTTKKAVGFAVLFIWCVISFSQISTFIYFNF